MRMDITCSASFVLTTISVECLMNVFPDLPIMTAWGAVSGDRTIVLYILVRSIVTIIVIVSWFAWKTAAAWLLLTHFSLSIFLAKIPHRGWLSWKRITMKSHGMGIMKTLCFAKVLLHRIY